jgi:uncharacterized protein YjcR
MHGCAKGSGAPKNNKNALKHGAFTREAFDHRRELQQLIAQAKELIGQLSQKNARTTSGALVYF